MGTDNQIRKRENMENKSRHFRCDCGWGFHSLFIEPDWGEEQFPFTIVQVVNAPSDYTIWKRIGAAWDILLGKQHALSEIYIHRDDMKDFVEYIVSLAHNPNTK